VFLVRSGPGAGLVWASMAEWMSCDDFIIGAYMDDSGGSNAGQTYLILSKNIPTTLDVTFTVDAMNGTAPASYTCADMDGDDSVENCMLDADFSLPEGNGVSWDHPHFWDWILYSEGVVIQPGDLAELTLNDVNLNFSWVAEGCTTFECQNTTVHQNTHRGAYYLRPTDCVWFQNPGVSQFEDGFDNNNTWRCFDEVGDYPSGLVIFHVTEEPTECELWEQENPFLVDRAKPEGEMDNGCPCYGTGDETCDDDSKVDEQESNNTSSNDNGTITVSVTRLDIPEHPEWEWTYKYLVEVDNLQMDVNYTTIIIVKRVGDDEWGGLDWWWDIDWEGGYDEDNDGYHNQSENPISLQRGCYHINANLYESGALHSDEDSAAVLVSTDLDFAVGTGTCVDGVYSEVDDSSETGGGDEEPLAGQCTCPDGSIGQMVGPADDDGVDDGCLCEDSEDESPLPSVSMISALISIGLIAILRRK